MGDPINDFANGFSKNQLIGYFLILWAVTFFLSAISTILWFAEGRADLADIVVDGLWTLADLGITAVLVLLGFKILNEKQ
jgi:hypothetical protein